MTRPRPLTILQVAAPGHAGGLESVLLELAGGLGALGPRVVVAAIIDPCEIGHPIPDRLAARGVEVIRISAPARSYRRQYRALRQVIASLRPDVVHTHGYHADLLGGLAARRAGVPWVATAHGFTAGDRKNRLYEWLQVRAYRRASTVIAVSRPIGERLRRSGVADERVLVLPNAWSGKPLLSRAEARARLGLLPGDFVIGWVGRLTREKGADVLLSALSELQDFPWHASIVGAGPERSALAVQASSLGIAGRVSWHGLVPEAAALFQAFDAFVLSSRTEGTPIALFEAMAARVPAVATAVGGVPDVATAAEALLVPSERPSDLAAALREIQRDPEAAEQRAEAALQRLLTRFQPAAWLDTHLARYRAVSSTQ